MFVYESTQANAHQISVIVSRSSPCMEEKKTPERKHNAWGKKNWGLMIKQLMGGCGDLYKDRVL